jgi:proteic killer suppression protein
MIESITHRGLRLLWEKDDPSKLPPEQVAKIRRILESLETAKTLNPLRAIPGYKLHSLSGNLKGFWSVWVTGNYRIIFRFQNENVVDVDYMDYH